MNDEDAIGGLKRLGLTTYEARVFLALQKLGSGSASDISDVADVPRSQVYGAAESLEERGLVEIQQSTPTVYQPVPLEQARRTLLDQLAKTGSETFDYLDAIQDTEEKQEQSESIWMIHGRDAVTSRIANLTQQADNRILYAADSPERIDSAVLDSLKEATERGVEVIFGSVEDEAVAVVSDEEWLYSYKLSEDRDLDVDVARLLIADGETILLSTRSMGTDGDAEEVAFWTSENAFASVLGELAEAWMEDPF